MEREGKKRAVVGPLFFMLLGGLTGAVLSLLYAPSNGESTRHYLHMQSERARRRARGINTRIRDIIDTLIEEIKDCGVIIRFSNGEVVQCTILPDYPITKYRNIRAESADVGKLKIHVIKVNEWLRILSIEPNVYILDKFDKM